jgi:hypothetical protein
MVLEQQASLEHTHAEWKACARGNLCYCCCADTNSGGKEHCMHAWRGARYLAENTPQMKHLLPLMVSMEVPWGKESHLIEAGGMLADFGGVKNNTGREAAVCS